MYDRLVHVVFVNPDSGQRRELTRRLMLFFFFCNVCLGFLLLFYLSGIFFLYEAVSWATLFLYEAVCWWQFPLCGCFVGDLFIFVAVLWWLLFFHLELFKELSFCSCSSSGLLLHAAVVWCLNERPWRLFCTFPDDKNVVSNRAIDGPTDFGPPSWRDRGTGELYSFLDKVRQLGQIPI